MVNKILNITLVILCENPSYHHEFLCIKFHAILPKEKFHANKMAHN